MQFAKDKRSGVELSAEQAIARRTYACPVCGEDVYVRGGFIRVRHFAHRSGGADPNCENYHGGSAIVHPLTPPGRGRAGFGGDTPAHIDPPTLGLRVEAAAGVARGDKRRWRLVLTLPKSSTGFGKLRIRTGFGTQRREVRLFSLAQSTQHIEMSPNAMRFGPEWISDEVDYAYRVAVSDGLDGFAHDSAQAFSATVAKIKPMTHTFVWGDSYYIIWKRSDFVIPEALNAILLASHEGWFAALVTLPTILNDDVSHWLQDSFHLRLHEAKRGWGIVYPPPIDIDLDGNIFVSDATSVVLGFREATDAEGESLTISVTTTATQAEVAVKPGTECLFHIARDAINLRGSLQLQWGAKHLPSVRAVQVAEATVSLPVVTLHVRDRESNRDATFPYHRPEARQALNRIRQGRAELVAISAPRSLVGRLEQRSGGGPWKQTLLLDGGIDGLKRGSSWTLSAVQLSAIAEVLANVANDVRLSFGAFGQYTAVARSRRVVTRGRLSADTRRRLIWYCQANGQRANPRRVVDLSNDDLVKAFSRASPSPHLIAHRNLLLQRLRVEGYARSVR